MRSPNAAQQPYAEFVLPATSRQIVPRSLEVVGKLKDALTLIVRELAAVFVQDLVTNVKDDSESAQLLVPIVLKHIGHDAVVVVGVHESAERDIGLFANAIVSAR